MEEHNTICGLNVGVTILSLSHNEAILQFSWSKLNFKITLFMIIVINLHYKGTFNRTIFFGFNSIFFSKNTVLHT